MSSIKVISRPHGWGLFTINRSSKTLKLEMKIHSVNKREGDWYNVRYAVKSQATIASTMGRGGNSVNAQTKGKKEVTKTGRNVSSSEQTKCVREAWMGSRRELARSILARSTLTRASSFARPSNESTTKYRGLNSIKTRENSSSLELKTMNANLQTKHTKAASS